MSVQLGGPVRMFDKTKLTTKDFLSSDDSSNGSHPKRLRPWFTGTPHKDSFLDKSGDTFFNQKYFRLHKESTQ